MTQEGAFAGVALDEMDLGPGPLGERDGDHQPRKARARAEVEPAQRLRLDRQELQRVGDVAGPDLAERRRPDQVLDPLPAPELRDQKVEPRRCFT